jgi:site-specific DNA-methyltransferase (adenine-specific)
VIDPYYSDDQVTLYHGDCIELADLWTCADVLVTDPPYGLDAHLSHAARADATPERRRAIAKPDWDKDLRVRDAALELWARGGRGGDRPYAVFGSPARIDAAPRFREFPLVWDKGSVGMGDTRFPWGRGYELIYIAGGGWNGKRESPVLRAVHASSAPNRIGHPTPKPQQLMETLISKAPAGVIADPFAGSGSTLVAAKALGRRAIGIELDEKYCEVAARRLAQDVLDLGPGV